MRNAFKICTVQPTGRPGRSRGRVCETDNLRKGTRRGAGKQMGGAGSSLNASRIGFWHKRLSSLAPHRVPWAMAEVALGFAFGFGFWARAAPPSALQLPARGASRETFMATWRRSCGMWARARARAGSGNFATCRLPATLINCHETALLLFAAVVVAVAVAGFNLAPILCKIARLREEREKSSRRGQGAGGWAGGRHLSWLQQMQLPRVLTDGKRCWCWNNVANKCHSGSTLASPVPSSPLPAPAAPLHPAALRLSCLALAQQIVYLNGS